MFQLKFVYYSGGKNYVPAIYFTIIFELEIVVEQNINEKNLTYKTYYLLFRTASEEIKLKL